MTYVIAALAGLALVAGLFAYIQLQRARKLSGQVDRARDRAKKAEAQASEYRHIISRIQEVNADAAEQKREHRKGDEDEQFEKTIDILSDS